MEVLKKINGLVWGPPTLILILILGICLSVSTGFAQIRLFPRAFSYFVQQFRKKGSSSFRSMCTALSATVGTGNLAGVAGAIALGGPGAIFWMWLCGILGMVIKYAEATLAVACKRKDENGQPIGGPMYMIRDHLPSGFHFLAWIYCFFGVVASFGVGNATQINAVTDSLRQALESRELLLGSGFYLLCGCLLAAATYFLLSGGRNRIGKAVEKLIPFAAGSYILLSLGVLILRREAIPIAFAQIARGVFSPRAVTGGAVVSGLTALRIGVSRGVFTNEAGMGTAAMAHAGARVSHPVNQGMMGIMEVFLDTLVICTLTALVILVSGAEIPYGDDPGAALTASAFTAVYGSWVGVVITLELCLFAFATVLGWGLYGGLCAQFLFGPQVWRLYPLVQGLMVIVGATMNTGTLWLLSEIVNGCMALPNLTVLFFLTPKVRQLTRSFIKMQREKPDSA